jgi:hypothetical protein
MKKLPNTVSEIYSDVKENEIFNYKLKGITPADKGQSFFLEQVEGLNSNCLIIDSTRLILNDAKQDLIVSVDFKEVDDGFVYSCGNAKYDIKILEHLLNLHSFGKYNITNKVSGQTTKGPLYLVEVEASRHLGDQSEFNKLGYQLWFRL